MTNMIRPFWGEKEKAYWKQYWEKMSVTVLVCQRKTLDITRLCMESLLRWYPDIPVLIVDGDSQDESTTYCKMLVAKYENVTLWERVNNLGGKHSSHGETMHDAIAQHIKTDYVLLLDSDTIIERGGFIEQMVNDMRDADLPPTIKPMAIGTIMEVSYDNEACGAAEVESDMMRYAHPSCSLYDVKRYLECGEPFCNHGAPCYRTMRYCWDWDIPVLDFPVENYVSHLSGSSWTEPRTVWDNDHEVIARPFFSTVLNPDLKDNDIQQMFLSDEAVGSKVVCHDNGVPVTITNMLYSQRFKVLGEYVIIGTPEWKHLEEIKSEIIKAGMPNEYHSLAAKFIRRQHWQRNYAIS